MKKNVQLMKTFLGARDMRTGRIVKLGPQLGCVVFAKNDDALIRKSKMDEALVRYNVVLSSDGSYLELYAPIPANR